MSVSRPDELLIEALVLNSKFDFGKNHSYGNFENRGKIPWPFLTSYLQQTLRLARLGHFAKGKH